MNEVQYVDVDDIIPYENNPRDNDAAVDAVAASIDEFGFQQPLVCDKDMVLVVGHTRLKAAKRLGYAQVPVVVASELTDEQIRAYRLADNKTAERATWDFELLSDELEAITTIDMSQFDFDVSVDVDMSSMKSSDDVEDEDVPESAPTLVSEGDVWQLGRHRLMCGDSTDVSSVELLMDGNRADVCFTSPPYNMSASGDFSSTPEINMGGGNDTYKKYDDNLSDDGYSQLLIDALGNALTFCDDAMFNIGIIKGSKHGVFEMIGAFRKNFCDVLVWKKRDALPLGMESQRALVKHICELIFCFNQKGNRAFSHPQWDKGCGSNLIETFDALGNEYSKVHHATFPVSLAAQVIESYTDSSVLDLFGGTGTTLVAAEQLGRTCYMMELDPAFCDIIIERWQNLTGETAVKVSSAEQE